jgi:hypothetical protein
MDNNEPNLDVMDEEFTTGQDSAKEIPNAQPGEAIGGVYNQDGASEQFGDVGNQLDETIKNQRREDEFVNDDSDSE